LKVIWAVPVIASILILGTLGLSQDVFADTMLSGCRQLTIPGETYVLTRDVSASGNCFTVLADGITLDGDGHRITSTAITHFGVVLNDRSDVTIKNLLIEKYGIGIFMTNSDNNKIDNVDVFSGLGSLQLQNSDNNLITNSFFGAKAVPLQFIFSDNNVFTDNIVSNSGPGAELSFRLSISHGNIITDNIFSDIRSFSIDNSDNNQVYNNNFLRILSFGKPFVSGSDNIFNLDAPIGGNYWAIFDSPGEGCNDSNSDGFCDFPFRFSGGQDNLPWTTQDGWNSPPEPSDTIPPEITLLGSPLVTLVVGETYVEAGATVTDNSGEDLSGSLIIDASGVNTSVAGTYIVTYDVSDSSGNAALQVTRTVQVITPAQAIQNLIDLVLSMELPKGTENSLISNLDTAIDKLEDSNPNNDSVTCGILGSFVNKVDAQDGKKLATDQAETLRGLAEDIQAAIDCI